ncbi:DUF1850 domain-containing protein [Sporosarcina ureilytica]|uniref:RocC n=1 Tax=Sporosarcina ureilytica TaxID=298596 RepID=A0A1D8JI91_9BACL|nr:DUF1850 domain-containing protein [Sporosarcina ureilytica]AOV08429.1 hypothetical protein BI350_13395 [Sporosarcina ureilytica]
MRNIKTRLLFLFLILILSAFFFLPMTEALLFSDTRSNKFFYVTINERKAFEIRYVHSIHLTDVIESYEITPEQKIRLLSMSYQNLSIGLPGEAAEGETLELKDGVYTLTYNDRVIDSFRLHIGRVDADLALRYDHNELDLKRYLEKGKTYEFKVQKLTYYQLMKGENLNG